MPNDKPPTPTDLITRRVRELRERRGLTQEELAERVTSLGVVLHQSAVARIEKGHRKVTLEEGVRLALALDVPLGALFLPLDNSIVALAPLFHLEGDEAHEWLAGDRFIPWADDADGPTWPPLDELTVDGVLTDDGLHINDEVLSDRMQDFQASRPAKIRRALTRPGVPHLSFWARTYVRLAGVRTTPETAAGVLQSMRYALDRMIDEIARQHQELDRLEAEGKER